MKKILAALIFASSTTSATVVYGPAANPGVTNIAGYPVSGTAPTSGQIITWNSTTGQWTPAAPAASGVASLLPVGSGNPNGDGATITGSTLSLEEADGSNPGVVTTGAQTFAGDKTFVSDIRNPGVPRAWVVYHHVAGVPTVIAQYNVASLTDVSPGIVHVVFTEAMPGASYGTLISQTVIDTTPGAPYTISGDYVPADSDANGVRVRSIDENGDFADNPESVTVVVYANP